MTRESLEIAIANGIENCDDPADRNGLVSEIRKSIELALKLEVKQGRVTTDAQQRKSGVEVRDVPRYIPDSNDPEVGSVVRDVPEVEAPARVPTRPEKPLVEVVDRIDPKAVREAREAPPIRVTSLATASKGAMRPVWTVQALIKALENQTPLRITVSARDRVEKVTLDRNIMAMLPGDAKDGGVKLIYKHPAADESLSCTYPFWIVNGTGEECLPRELPIEKAMETIEKQAWGLYARRESMLASRVPINPNAHLTLSPDAPHANTDTPATGQGMYSNVVPGDRTQRDETWHRSTVKGA